MTVLESAGCQVTGCLFVEGGPAIGVRGQSRLNQFVGNVFLSGCRTGIQLDAEGGGNLIAPDGSLLDSVSTGCRVYPAPDVESVPAPACAVPCGP